jgi:hypothetical protein
MSETDEPAKVCPSCGNANRADAEHCANCGADLGTTHDPSEHFVDDDPKLRSVPTDNRHEVSRFERWDEAELACGLLRANGIACELSPMPLPGLPADIILWVHNRDAEVAWALLADAEREAFKKDNDAA